MRIQPVHFLSALFLGTTLALSASPATQAAGESGQGSTDYWRDMARALGERHSVASVFPLDPKTEELRRALRETVLPQLVVAGEEHLSVVLDVVRTLTDLPIVMDPRAQEVVYDEGIEFQFDLAHPLAVEHVLNLIADAGGEQLSWTIAQDTVLFTTLERAQAERVVFFHPIADLFPTFENDDIATLVQENVAPRSWEEDGVAIEAHGPFLIVVSTVHTQLACESFLSDLRTFHEGMAKGITILETGSPEPQDVRVLERLAAVRFSARFGAEGEGVPLTEIAAFLQQLTEVNFVVDASVEDEIDSDELQFVLELPERSVRDVLDMLVRVQRAIAWRVGDGVVEFVPRDRLSGGQSLTLFDIRELVFPGELAFSLSEEEPEPRVLDADVLEDLIRNTVAPNTWDEDPANSLRISRQGVMLVNQRPEVQVRIRALLADLRGIAGVMREEQARHGSGR